MWKFLLISWKIHISYATKLCRFFFVYPQFSQLFKIANINQSSVVSNFVLEQPTNLPSHTKFIRETSTLFPPHFFFITDASPRLSKLPISGPEFPAFIFYINSIPDSGPIHIASDRGGAVSHLFTPDKQ